MDLRRSESRAHGSMASMLGIGTFQLYSSLVANEQTYIAFGCSLYLYISVHLLAIRSHW